MTETPPQLEVQLASQSNEVAALCTVAELEEVVLEIEIPTRQDDNIHFDRDSGHVDEVRKIEILCLFRTSVVIGLISHSQDLLDQLSSCFVDSSIMQEHPFDSLYTYKYTSDPGSFQLSVDPSLEILEDNDVEVVIGCMVVSELAPE